MIAVLKKFRPLVEWGSPRFKKNIITFQYTEPAPPGGRVEWWSMLNEVPTDVMWDVIIPEGLYMCGQSCWTSVVVEWSHMLVMSLFEVPCTSSICLCCLVIRSFDREPIHHIAVDTFAWHGTCSFVLTVALANGGCLSKPEFCWRDSVANFVIKFCCYV